MNKQIDISTFAVSCLFVIVAFITTRQVPFSFLSPIMNISVLLMCVIAVFSSQVIRRYWQLVISVLFLPLVISLMYSIVLTDNELGNILRFFSILLFLGLAYFITVERWAIRCFIIFCILQVVVMAAIHLWISFSFDIKSYLPIRFFFMSMGWGDVYTYDGFFYRIQIKGSALLVVALMINNEFELFRYKNWINLLLLLGVVIAGNFAYLISVALYVVFVLFNMRNNKSSSRYLFKIISIFSVGMLLSPVIWKYVVGVLNMKSEGSIGTRSDQFVLLIQDVNESIFSLFLGQGLGNTIDVVTRFRNYTGDLYYELQSVYIFNQLGIIFFSIYLLYHVLVSYELWREKINPLYILYGLYILYAFTNPYIFDTNHFLVIIILNSMMAEMKSLEQTTQMQLH